MHGKLVVAALATAAIALPASAQNPLSAEGPFFPGEFGLEVLDTGLLVRDTRLDIATLYHSCPELSSKDGKRDRKGKGRHHWRRDRDKDKNKDRHREPLVTADDIPVAHTPGCGYEEFPPPVLAECNEPLAEGVADLRGLWVAYEGDRPGPGHVERIEQCGNRVVITGGGVIHDMRADGTAANGVNDVSAIDCGRIRVSAEFVNGSLDLKVLGFFIAAQRRLEGDELVFSFLGNSNRLVRVCEIGP